MRTLALVAVVACASAPASPPPAAPKPTAVFPPPPAFRLDHTFEPTSYRARIALAEPRFTGAIEIHGTLAEPTKTIWLHGDGIAIASAQAVRDHTRVPLDVTIATREQVIGLQAHDPLAAGAWTLVIEYTGGIDLTEPPPLAPRTPGRPSQAPKTFGIFRRRVNGHSYYFTQSESIYARRIFPCIDEPDRKVPWQLTLDIPSDVDAYSNTPVTRETALDGKHKRIEFAPTLPLPSYLVAFAIGAFDVEDAGKTRHGVPIRLIAPRGDGKTVAQWAAPARQILATYEDWFEIPYPYPKLDLVYVPRFGLGGMENAGLITVEESFGGDLGLTVLAHELAHQWFGDLVTHAWWDDVWLTEKMASWMAARVSTSHDAIVDHELAVQSAQALRDLAYRRHPIRVPIKESRALDAIDEMYDYNGDIFSLYESYLGPDTFRRALHLYLEHHANGTATAADFATALSEASGQSLDASFMGFVEHTGVPRFGLGLSCASGGHRVMVAHLSDVAWPVPMCFAYDHDGKRDQHCESIEPTTTSVELPATRCPKWFVPGSDGVSLAQTTIAQPDLDALLGPSWTQLTPRERRALFIDLKRELPILTALRRLVDGGDTEAMRLAAGSLITLYELVPPDLHAKLDAWILRRFEPFRANLHLVAGTDTSAVAELLAIAGDPALVAEARALTDPRYARFRLRVLTEHDPALTEQILDKVQRRASTGDELDAVSRAHTTLAVLQHSPALVHGLHPRTVLILLQTQCDGMHTPAHDALAHELADPEAHFEDIWQACAEKQQRLAPAFAKLMALP